MSQSFSAILLHVIFSTKDRAPDLSPDLRDRLFPYMGGILAETGAKPLLINGTGDHVHLLFSLPAALAFADVIRVLKANSSRWVHEQFPEHRRFAWQAGYGACSVSQSQRASVLQYIREQEQHHRRRNFQEEFTVFLRRHGIEFDPRLLWA
jgi:REP element-mobilizing transposase RayT